MQTPDSSLRLPLREPEETLALGACLAGIISELTFFPAMLLNGELGAGKTTFVRGLVQALPGGDQAEVASPSFNYMNNYPTIPETFHFDFYRLQHHGMDEELLDALRDHDGLIIAEWAQLCPEEYYPEDRLSIHFNCIPQGRVVEISAHGDQALRVLRRLQNQLDPTPG